MRALRVRRRTAKFAVARVASAFGSGGAARVGPIDLVDIEPPDLPGPGWHRVRPRLVGICGSDLSLVEGHASAYFEDWVSFPFVPGHEIVGDTDDGRRVVIEPVLGHEARGFAPPFPEPHRVTATTTRISWVAPSNPESRPGSVARRVAAGPTSSSPTRASSTRFPTR